MELGNIEQNVTKNPLLSKPVYSPKRQNKYTEALGNHWKFLEGGITLTDLCFRKIVLAVVYRMDWRGRDRKQ